MRGVLAPLLLATICAACSDLGGLTGGDETQPARPGSTNPDGGPCAGDECLPEPTDVIYVAEGGNDTNDGKSPDKPKKTIGGAIALLATTGAPNFEVHVCRGTYVESVTLDYATSLRGGYECSTWKRADGNETVIAAPDGAPALTVKGVTGVSVEGFTMRGSNAGTTRSTAVVVGAGASVELVGNRVLGGGGTTKASPASVGIYLENGGVAKVEKSYVDGGSATLDGGGYGSVGIAVGIGKEHDACALRVSASEVHGGSGTVNSGTGATGILAVYGSVSAIDESRIFGGAGKTGGGSSTAGVIVSGVTEDLTFAGNQVDGGSGSCTGNCTTVGASLSPNGKLTAHGNRIVAGEVAAPGFDARFIGLVIADTPNVDVQNNQIFTGNTKHALTSTAGAIETRGLGTAIIAQNTLVLGSSVLGSATALVVAAKQATVANNLFVNAGGTVDQAVRVSACDSAKVVSFRNNAWAGFPDGKAILAIDEPDSQTPIICKSAATSATTASGAESALAATFAGAAIAGNQTLASSAAVLFGGWNEPTGNDLLASGWKLAPTAACSIVKGSGDVGGLSATDAFGAPRTDPRSIGASESDGACQ